MSALSTPSPSPRPRLQSGRSVPYLFFLRNTPTFRIRIPADVQPCLKRTEYRRSLGRCYAPQMKRQALNLAATALSIFSFVREALTARDYRPHSKNDTSASTQVQMNARQRRMNQGHSHNHNGYTKFFDGRELGSLSDEEIRAIADMWMLKAMEDSNACLMSTAAIEEKSLRKTLGEGEEISVALRRRLLEQMEEMRNLKSRDSKNLSLRNIERMTQHADALLSTLGVLTDKDLENSANPLSRPYLNTCLELLKRQVEMYDIMLKTYEGDFSTYDEKIHSLKESITKVTEKTNDLPAPQISQPARAESKTLQEAVKMFLDNRALTARWTQRTLEKESHKYELFLDIVDAGRSLPIEQLTAVHLDDYAKVIHGYPKNSTKNEAYRKIDRQKLIHDARNGAIPETERFSVSTIENHYREIKNFLNWAGERDLIRNPRIARLLKIKQVRRPHEFRDNFNEDELRKLFRPEIYLNEGVSSQQRSKPHPSRFWIPLLGLFTGARLEELSQLSLKDIVMVDIRDNRTQSLFRPGEDEPDRSKLWPNDESVLCLYIRDDETYQNIKNPGSRRLIPISHLLTDELNFLGYARETCRIDHTGQIVPSDRGRLFPDLTKTGGARDSYGNAVSKWFGRYKKIAGIAPDESRAKKDFHSFRHTIAAWGQNAAVQEKALQRYLGHTDTTMTGGRYAGELPPLMLYTRITLPFTEYVRSFLDVESLSKSQFASFT